MTRRPSVRSNILANALGQGWSGLLAIVLIPVYIKLLGVESYGLIGLFVTVQGALAILDFGLAGTINRELARGSQGSISTGQMRDLLRTFEWVYWSVAAAIAIASVALGPLIAGTWLTPVDLSTSDVAHALTLMGIVVAAQWPASLYGGALAGLQHQGLQNLLVVVFSTLRSAGVIAPLLWLDATIAVFFGWQLLISLLQTAAFATALWRKAPRGQPPRFSLGELGRVGKFAGGMAGMSATSFLMLQLDRLILAALLDLRAFGFYSTAAALASVVPRVVAPIAGAVYPRYSQLVAASSVRELTTLYHKTNQAVAILLAVLGAVAFFYAESVLYLWTGSREIAVEAGTLLKLLALGSVFAGLTNLPYNLQIAYGITRLSLSLTLVALCIYTPALWVAARSFGALGAASTWLCLHFALLIASPHLMHRTLLRGEEATWYRRDVIPVFASAFALAFAFNFLWPTFPRTLWGAALLCLVSALTFVAALLAAADVRTALFNSYPLKRLFGTRSFDRR